MALSAKELEERKPYIGASDMGTLFNLPNEDGSDRYGSRAELWAAKVYDQDFSDRDEFEDSPPMIGTLFEAQIIDYALRKITSDPPGFLSAYLKGAGINIDDLAVKKDIRYIDGHLAANLDSQIAERKNGRLNLIPFAIEAKSTGKWEEYGDEWTDQVPARVYLQCQAQCKAGNLLGAFVAVLLPGYKCLELRVYYVPASEKIAAKIMKEINSFWTKYVETRIPPPDAGSTRASEIFRRIIREPNKVATIPAEAIQAYVHAAAEETGAKKAKIAAQNDLYKYLGDAELGVPDDPETCGFEVTYNLQKRAEYTVKATEYRVLRKRKIK